MDWIKVKVKHAEYDMAEAPDNVFKAWIMSMIYVAATERKPLREQLHKRIGEDNCNDLENWLQKINISLDTIFDKVLEDVEVINRRKSHSRKYMEQYRCKALRKPLRVDNVNAKRREEKRREDKSITNTKNLDFITTLKTALAYKHIDIDSELSKMDVWLVAHPGRQKTKRFITNWLNKIEKPMEVKKANQWNPL